MTNVGKLWEGEVKKLLDQLYPIVIREYDLRGKRFTKPKMFDFICCGTRSGRFIAVEAKATRKTVFPFSSISERQHSSLSNVLHANGVACLALNLRDKRGPGYAWLIPWGAWLTMEVEWERKSIRLEEVAEIFSAFELKRVIRGWSLDRVGAQ